MLPRHDSYSKISSLKNFQTPNNYVDRYNAYILNHNNNANTLTNSYQFYSRTCAGFPPTSYNTNTIRPTNNYLKDKIKTEINNNKREKKNEDIKKIVEVIEGIKENQKEIIAAIKDLKLNKETHYNDNINKPKKEENIEKNGVENNLLYSFNNSNEKYEKEISIFKQKEEENKKLIESNKKEIEDLKRNFLKIVSGENNNALIEKDKKIKELEELLKKSKDDNLNLKQKLIISENLNNKKDEEINSLKQKLDGFKGKSVINELEPKKLTDILNNLNMNMEFIKQSLHNNNINSMNNNMTRSISTFQEPNINIIRENGEFTG